MRSVIIFLILSAPAMADVRHFEGFVPLGGTFLRFSDSPTSSTTLPFPTLADVTWDNDIGMVTIDRWDVYDADMQNVFWQVEPTTLQLQPFDSPNPIFDSTFQGTVEITDTQGRSGAGFMGLSDVKESQPDTAIFVGFSIRDLEDGGDFTITGELLPDFPFITDYEVVSMRAEYLIPEPTGLALILIGCIRLGTFRRRYHN